MIARVALSRLTSVSEALERPLGPLMRIGPGLCRITFSAAWSSAPPVPGTTITVLVPRGKNFAEMALAVLAAAPPDTRVMEALV